MGGLINEKVEKFDDRVPFMGSIPFVGRLFRNEGERVVKRNLLMFVTANIIDPNGRADPSRSFE
jgi:general secretion pathway protein D